MPRKPGRSSRRAIPGENRADPDRTRRRHRVATGLDDGFARRPRDTEREHGYRDAPSPNVRPLRPEPLPEYAPSAERPPETPRAHESRGGGSERPARPHGGMVSPFEEDELDVPAFLRKRVEVDDEDRDSPAFLRRAQD